MKQLLILVVLALIPAEGVAGLFANQYRAFSGAFQQFLEVDVTSGSAISTSPLFALTGGVFALTFVEETLYGAELDNASQESFLVTIPHDTVPSGARVGANSIAAGGVVEALAYDDQSQTLYGALWDTSHNTDLLSIDSSTGEGTVIGRLGFDVVVVGMTFANGTLYAVSKGFGTLNPALYTIDPVTASETHVADLSGLDPQVQGFGPLESLAYQDGKLLGGWKALYEINTTTAVATRIGGDFSTSDGRDGLYGLAAEGTSVPVTPSTWGKIKARF